MYQQLPETLGSTPLPLVQFLCSVPVHPFLQHFLLPSSHPVQISRSGFWFPPSAVYCGLLRLMQTNQADSYIHKNHLQLFSGCKAYRRPLSPHHCILPKSVYASCHPAEKEIRSAPCSFPHYLST